MHHPTDRIAHTTAFVTPVVKHWLEREIAQWVHPMKDRSDDPLHHERTLLPRSYISLLPYWRTNTSSSSWYWSTSRVPGTRLPTVECFREHLVCKPWLGFRVTKCAFKVWTKYCLTNVHNKYIFEMNCLCYCFDQRSIMNRQWYPEHQLRWWAIKRGDRTPISRCEQ